MRAQRADDNSQLRGTALGDFDGDHRADFAVAQAQNAPGNTHSYRVDVHLSAHPSTAFDVDSQIPGGLHVAALDVDGDHDLDLVITTEFGREPVGVWINDGQGVFFYQDDSAAYSDYIWHPEKAFFEHPERPAAQAAVLFSPASGWVLKRGEVSLPLPSGLMAAKAAIDGHARSCANPSSPFRAPPLF